MKLFEVEDRDEILVDKLLEGNFVKVIHLFLLNYEIWNIKKYVSQALNEASHLIIVENENNRSIAFMGIENKKLEMLFINNSESGKKFVKMNIRIWYRKL